MTHRIRKIDPAAPPWRDAPRPEHDTRFHQPASRPTERPNRQTASTLPGIGGSSALLSLPTGRDSSAPTAMSALQDAAVANGWPIPVYRVEPEGESFVATVSVPGRGAHGYEGKGTTQDEAINAAALNALFAPAGQR